MSETPSASGRPCVSGTTCASEMARVSERPCVRETACVRSLCVREMTVGMREHATASPSGSSVEWCVSVMARRSALDEWRRRGHQRKDKGRVAAVAVLGTVPGLHMSGNRAPGLWGSLAGEGCQRCQESKVGSVPGEHGRFQCHESTVWVL